MAEHAVRKKKSQEEEEEKEEVKAEGEKGGIQADVRPSPAATVRSDVRWMSPGCTRYFTFTVQPRCQPCSFSPRASSLGLLHLLAGPIRNVNRRVTSETRLMEKAAHKETNRERERALFSGSIANYTWLAPLTQPCQNNEDRAKPARGGL